MVNIFSGPAIGVLVFGDGAAEGDAAEIVEAREDGVEDPAADILEIGIDSLRAELVEHRADVALGLVIEAGVVARLPHRPLALLLVAGTAHDAGAGELGELARHLPHGAGRGGDEHCLARLGLADVLDAVPGGEARHAQHTEIGRERQAGRVDLAQALAVMDRVGGPVQHADHDVALGVARVPRLDDLADRAAGQRLVELEGRRVGAQLGHAWPHVGIERQEALGNQDLALGEGGQGNGLGAEAVRGDVALGAPGEDDLLDVGHGSFLSSKSLRR
jgi:hypothetical protein